jgi:hypothetical protein
MNDFDSASLFECKNEWCARLVTVMTPSIVRCFKYIMTEAIELCKKTHELSKYAMTFQNLLSRVPKWNEAVILAETNKIVEESKCGYLEDLITCVHLVQLKLLTAIRVGQKQKKLSIHIPSLTKFVAQVYIQVSRQLYKQVYLMEVNVSPFTRQKHMHELELLIQKCILTTIRDSMPIETILRAYMDESTEDDIVEEIKEQIIEEPIKERIPPPPPAGMPAPFSVATGMPVDAMASTTPGVLSSMLAGMPVEESASVPLMDEELFPLEEYTDTMVLDDADEQEPMQLSFE